MGGPDVTISLMRNENSNDCVKELRVKYSLVMANPDLTYQ